MHGDPDGASPRPVYSVNFIIQTNGKQTIVTSLTKNDAAAAVAEECLCLCGASL